MLNYAQAIHKDSGKLIEVANDIYATPFWNEDFCNGLVGYLEHNPQLFTQSSKDGYKIKELNMSYLSKVLTIDMLKHHYKSCVQEVAKYFLEESFDGYIDPTILRYSTEKQDTTKLALHTDTSTLSSLLKLNSKYDGGETIFPRQKYSSVDLPVGYILMWPGIITHPHEVNEITAGTKYSLSIWTYPPTWSAPTGISKKEIVEV
jgi:hypothetical protein